MMRLLCFLVVFTLAASIVRGDQYWVAYEGDDFPENEGWTRITFGGGAERRIEAGSLVIDSRASLKIADFYLIDRGGSLDPGVGEGFVVQWRLRVDEVVGRVDPTIAVFSDERWAVGFELSEDTILSVFESGISATFEPGVFHEFELRSTNMRAYELYIDRRLAINGSFWQSLTSSRVGWGDGVQGGASLTHWDYFRFGVVPEPGSGLLLALAVSSWRLPR